MLSKRWIKHEGPTEAKDALCSELGISPITANILINRGIQDPADAQRFLRSSLDDLEDPFSLDQMDRVVARILKALKSDEKVLIFGDYDADGITATALLTLFFEKLGKKTYTYIPERLEEGYGISIPALQKIKALGVTLIITVDCGISSVEEVAVASAMGIDVIITDHHEPPAELPRAHGVIDPCIRGGGYAFSALAGVGVALKLAQGVFGGLEGRDSLGPGIHPELEQYLDLVALGTIADVVPLSGENRILVKHGLRLLGRSDRTGVIKLKEVAGVGGRKFSSVSVGFQLAPRLNASGRLGKAGLGVKLLTTDDPVLAREIAEELDGLNRERQQIEAAILDEAKGIIQWEIDPSMRTIVLASEKWHQGVIGIVASKLVDAFYKPTVLISLGEGQGKGSARSIPAFHLYNGLEHCSRFLESFGGHKYAAGLSIKEENLSAFREEFEHLVRETLSPEDFIPSLKIDGELDLWDLDWKLYDELCMLEPHGSGNPEPVLCSTGLEVLYPKVVGRNHVRMKLRQGECTLGSIGFNMGDIYQGLAMGGVVVDAAYCLGVNEWQGERRLQLNLKDVHF